MLQRHLSETDCSPTKEFFARIGDKWTLMILASLEVDKLRFTELRTRIGGVSQKVLTLALRGLERDGYVRRTVHASVPPQVDYELTALGCEMAGLVRELGSWAQRNNARITLARSAFDQRSG